MSFQMSRRHFVEAMALGTASLGLAACGASQASSSSQAPAGSSAGSSGQGGQGSAASSSTADEDSSLITKPLDNGYGEGLHHATIEVKDFGTISVELNANMAPITVSNFAQLANDGFYDGLTFHRVISGFMIQGGDPTGTGTGGSSRNIKGEFIQNGITNAIQHKRGVISMARSQDYNSASSQFFIMHADADYLDEQYAAFGRVTEGMDVVDTLAENTPVEDDNGTVAPENQPRITSITLVD